MAKTKKTAAVTADNNNQNNVEETSTVKPVVTPTVSENTETTNNTNSNNSTNEKKAKKKNKNTIEVSNIDEDEQITIPTVIERFSSDSKKGLTYDQVNIRIDEGMTNKETSSKTKSIKEILFTNIVTFFNMLLLGIAIALTIFGQYAQTTFLIIIVTNTIIGIVQEIKAKRTLEKLRLVTDSSVTVIRNGSKETVKREEVVLDDIFLLHNGEQVPTDAILLDGQIEVNESLLTGESLPIKKTVGKKIFAGSYVISGSCTARADLIGKYNYISSVQNKAKVLTKPKSEILISLNSIIRFITIIIVPLGILTFLTQWSGYAADTLTSNSTWEIAKATVSSAAASMVGMIPSGMYLLTSVALSTSILSLSKKNALVQDIYSVEMLARVDTLCLDKTGTLTDGTMKVSETNVLDKSVDLNTLMGCYLHTFDENNQTSIALSKTYQIQSQWKVNKSIPFSSERKFSYVDFGKRGAYVLGAPEYIYKGSDQKINDYISSKEASGFRVVLIARIEGDIVENKITGRVYPVAIFALEDHIRDNAPETISWFTNNGVEIKIISGDNPLTASEIAKKCNVPNADKFISLEGLNEREVAQLVSEYTVFGRVSPEQKSTIVKALQTNNHIVGMTGDGVNDILAMKNADCSVAMANGASAARNAAHLVLLDSNFSSMPAAVKEGRRAINNIQRSSSLYLMKTIFTVVFTIIVLLTFLPGGSHMKYPFTTQNMLPTEMISIGFASFALAIQENDAEIKDHFLPNIFTRAIPAALCLILAIGINYILLQTSDFLDISLIDGSFASTSDSLSFTTFNSLTMLSVSFMMTINCFLPLKPWKDKRIQYRWMMLLIDILFIIIGVFVFVAIPFGTESNLCLTLFGFDFRTLTKTMWLLLIIETLFFAFLLNVLIDYIERMQAWFAELKAKNELVIPKEEKEPEEQQTK